jgi:hypothetical protein
MSSPNGLRCPFCGHLTPIPKGRDFITCTCGLKIANGVPPVRKSGSGSGRRLFAFLTVACIVTAAVDLVRRLH